MAKQFELCGERFVLIEEPTGSVLCSASESQREMIDLVLAGPNAEAASPSLAGWGRGGAQRVALHSGLGTVLRPYRRGGFVRHLLEDQFYGGSSPLAPLPRPFRELLALILVRGGGATAPKPLAAGVRRHPGSRWYRGSILLREVEHAADLMSLDRSGDIDEEHVIRYGFLSGIQAAKSLLGGVLHVDLHPGNVLVQPDESVWLIDFDRAEFLSPLRPLLRARERLEERWSRAIVKHQLSPRLIDSFAAGLHSGLRPRDGTRTNEAGTR
ncbi:MAG: hypothetical protein KDD44_04710 [Bdellovibrionales bacterium]|nr:hypothetical protein [Bdellovibrionales bacterium]